MMSLLLFKVQYSVTVNAFCHNYLNVFVAYDAMFNWNSHELYT